MKAKNTLNQSKEMCKNVIDNSAGKLDKICSRLDNIEYLLQVLLVNDLADDVGQIITLTTGDIEPELQALLEKHGVISEGFKTINDVEVLVVRIPKKATVKTRALSTICSAMRARYLNVEPLFMFEVINGMQRKKMIQEGISFGVLGKELRLTTRRNKK